jgi:hypothetical protein
MTLTRKCPVGWVKVSNGNLQTDRFGLSQAVAKWVRMDKGDSDPGTPAVFGNVHPLWSFLECDKVSIAQTEAGWEAEAAFFGCDGNPDPIYDLDYSTSEEPIETHKDFDTTLAGTSKHRLHGAVFDSLGAFLGFTNFGEDAELAATWRGISSYLNPGAIWRKNYVTKTRPTDVGQLGRIDVPEGNPPSVPNGRNWLYIGLTWEQRGLTYQVRKEWRLSGRRGWNQLIYS